MADEAGLKPADAQLSRRAEQFAEPHRSTFAGKESMRIGEVTDVVAALQAEMFADPWGEFSPSVYETARLVTRTPSLRGHMRRLRFLLDRQDEDGGWGGPAGYGLVPTLSATEALLTALRQLPSGVDYEEVVGSANGGLRWLFERLNACRPPRLPDTVAVEIILTFDAGLSASSALTENSASPVRASATNRPVTP